MWPFRLRAPALLLVMVVVLLVISLHPSPSASGTARREQSPSVAGGRKVKRESDVAATPYDGEREESEPSEEVIYDQRQVGGETNIRLNIKNFQLRVPESQLVHLQQSDMAQMIRNSVLRLLGIPTEAPATDRVNPVKRPVGKEEKPDPPPDATEQQSTEDTGESAEGSASMLQVNGNNLPAKFFLEISDFLMNTFDNDAVDDKRVETNHNQHQQMELQQMQSQQGQQGQQGQDHLRQSSAPQTTETPLYAMEEITIERVANTNNVQNETITISKRIKQVVPTVPANGTALETVSTEHRSSSNATRNATANEDRFVQTKPIRLDTVLVRVETDAQGHPKTLREKVIWKMPDGGQGAEGAP